MTTAPIGESLLPCPFCGRLDSVREADNNENWEVVEGDAVMQIVVCDANLDGCGGSTGLFDTRREAKDSWNRRAAMSGEVARLRGALERSAALIGRIYAGGPDCDCTMDGGSHTCGWPEVIRAHEKNTEALKDPS